MGVLVLYNIVKRSPFFVGFVCVVRVNDGHAIEGTAEVRRPKDLRQREASGQCRGGAGRDLCDLRAGGLAG